MRQLLAIVTLTVSSLLLAGCYSHYGVDNQNAKLSSTYSLQRKIENIIYTPADWPQPLRADLSLPQRAGPIPVVVTLHGGSWASRHRSDMDAISKKLVHHGYAVLNISYRFAPKYTFPAQLQDLQQAINWIAMHARTYRLDVERINSWGYSAGAQLAALIASYDNSAKSLPELPRINAVVAGGIPSDLRKYGDSPIVGRFLGGAEPELPQVYADASPIYHISSDDPPVFLYHGRLDLLVGVDQSINYYQALQAAGVQAELFLHNWHGHLTMFQFGGDAEDNAISFLNRNNDIP